MKWWVLNDIKCLCRFALLVNHLLTWLASHSHLVPSVIYTLADEDGSALPSRKTLSLHKEMNDWT